MLYRQQIIEFLRCHVKVGSACTRIIVSQSVLIMKVLWRFIIAQYLLKKKNVDLAASQVISL